MTTQNDANFRFRCKLKQLSDQLTPGDLDSLRVLCSGHVNVESATSGIVLWKVLQDCNMIGIDNLQFLESLFADIGKQHLFETVFDQTSSAVIPQGHSEPGREGSKEANERKFKQASNDAVDHTIQRDADYQFRYKLKHLSHKLTPSDLDKLKEKCCEDKVISVERSEKITTSIMLWKELQNCNIIGENNLEYLQQLLSVVDKQLLFVDLFDVVRSHDAARSHDVVGSHDPVISQFRTALNCGLDLHTFGSLTTLYSDPIQTPESINRVAPTVQGTEGREGQSDIITPSAPPMPSVHPAPNNFIPPNGSVIYPQPGITAGPPVDNADGYLDAYYYPMSDIPQVPYPVIPVYNMNQNPHGLCVIITNYHFAEHSDRKGSEIDLQRLLHLFAHLGYDVEHKKDLGSQQMKGYLDDIADRVEHSNADSFVCCILSHGDEDHIFGSDSQVVGIDDLVTPFKGSKCHDLAGKPKLFFIQSCRGGIEDESVEIFESDGRHRQPQHQHTLPSEADFFFGFATTRGCSSYRSQKQGSWYISNLYEVMMEYSRYGIDLLTMHTIVNQRVCEMTATGQTYKQCSAPVSTLRKRVVFT